MYCTNCGAKVDDHARFCPECGHKLNHKQNGHANKADQVEKSTYESIKNNENVSKSEENSQENKITENKAVENKENESKIKKFISSFTLKKDSNKKDLDKTEQEISQDIFDNDNNYKHLNQKLEVEEAKPRDIPPSYYGYNLVEDRQRKDLRNPGQKDSNNPAAYVQNKILHSKGESDAKERIEEKNKDKLKEDKLVNENNLSTQRRIAQNLGQAAGYVSKDAEDMADKKVSYDDIPNEFVEARIARQINGGGPKMSYKKPLDEFYHKEDRTNAVNRPVGASDKKEPNHDQDLASHENISKDQNQSQDQSPTDQEKKSFEFKPIYLLPLLIIVLAAAGIYFLKNRKAPEVEIDLSEYIDVAYSGDDGAAIPSASLNASKLLSDYGNDIAYVNKDRKNDQYSSPANQLVDDLENSTNFQFSKDSNLSNGEEITVVANVADNSIMDDYNIMFTNTIKSVIVDGLITQENVDPFEYIDVNFEGESPEITLSAKFKEDAPEYLQNIDIVPSKTSQLKAGEEVNVSLNFDEEEIFNSYGIRLSPTDKTFTAPGEASDEDEENEDDEEKPDLEGGYISTIDNLDEDLLGTLKYNAGQLIRETFGGRSFTEIDEINYLGAITGSDASADLKNRVMLVYQIRANEDYEGRYKNQFTYYSFVEYQNVKDSKDDDGKFYQEGPITTDNEIFHKFFVEDDYTYYEIPYYGFAFLEEVITRVNNALSGLDIEDSISVDISEHFAKSDGLVGEYQGNGNRLSINEDGSLRYKIDERVHTGTWNENGSDVTLTIEGVNVDTPINAKYEDGSIKVAEQGEMSEQTFNKMESF